MRVYVWEKWLEHVVKLINVEEIQEKQIPTYISKCIVCMFVHYGGERVTPRRGGGICYLSNTHTHTHGADRKCKVSHNFHFAKQVMQIVRCSETLNPILT